MPPTTVQGSEEVRGGCRAVQRVAHADRNHLVLFPLGFKAARCALWLPAHCTTWHLPALSPPTLAL